MQEKENTGLGHLNKIEDIVKLEEVVSELEAECKKVQEERDAIKEKLGAHDIAAKRAITALQKELSTRIEQVYMLYSSNVFLYTHDLSNFIIVLGFFIF